MMEHFSPGQKRSPAAGFDLWLWKMAWRDSRHHRRRMLLSMSSIILGIAALAAISSFGGNLEDAIDREAKTLLGADLEIRSRQPLTAEAEALIDSLGGEQSREMSFASMVYFPQNKATRLVQVRALEGNFPYYGEFETIPASAAESFKHRAAALVDQTLMLQYDLKYGDSIVLGRQVFPVIGELTRAPGQATVGAVIAPRIYIAMSEVEKTGLIRFGSRVSYHVYFKFPAEVDIHRRLESIRPQLNRYRLSAESAEQRKENLGRAMQNLYRFLSLVAFIALLLGSIGVASAVHVHVKQKLTNVAVLRCLGAQIKQTFYIYLIQALVLGFIGSLLGALGGVIIQIFLPKILGDFMVVDIDFSIAWKAILSGVSVGMGMTVLFALLPLLTIRKVSPLLALRSSFENRTASHPDPLRWILYGLIVLTIAGFAVSQSSKWIQGIIFTVGLAIALALLTGIAKLLMVGVKKFFPVSWNYVWRQSLANLYRPNNQTLVLMLALGLGTFLLTTLYLTQTSLLKQVSLTGGNRQPNLVFFDIQSDQRADVEEFVRSFGLPVMQQVPIVPLRLKAIKGRTVEEIRSDSSHTIPNWSLTREYRVTYRDSLLDTEKIVAGEWVPEMQNPSEFPLISLEENIAEDLGVTVGDTLVVDVQGIPLTTRVGNIRQVNWQRIQPNFFIVFPKGVLEDAPQIFVLVTRAPSAEISADIQRAAVQRFPNVSAIDLALILKTADSILSKVSFVIRFMALFSIVTGMIVLVGAVVTTRFQRTQESVLLRTLGASKRQISAILALEYFYLGALAALTGIILAFLGSWALSYYVFETAFTPQVLPALFILLLVSLVTVFLGWFNSRGIAIRAPLEVLRAEA